MQTAVNETLNALSDLKEIPISIAKRGFLYFISKRHNTKNIIVYNPMTFDNRLIEWTPSAKSSLDKLAHLPHVKKLDWKALWEELNKLGLLNYFKAKAKFLSIKSVHQHFFLKSSPTTLDYSESLDSILPAKLAQHFQIEPKTQTIFERLLTSMFKNVFRALEVRDYCSGYFERLGALYAAKIVSGRANWLLANEEKQLSDMLEPIDKRVEVVKGYFEIMSGIKKTIQHKEDKK